MSTTRALMSLVLVALLVLGGVSAVAEQRQDTIQRNGNLDNNQEELVNDTANYAGSGFDAMSAGVFVVLAAVLLGGIATLGRA